MFFFFEKFVLGIIQQSLIRELFTTPESNKSQLLELPEPEHGYGKAAVIPVINIQTPTNPC